MAPCSVPRWLQAPGDLGAKLEGIMRRGLEEEGAEAVIAIGADSPGRPASRLEDVMRALSGTDAADVVLGPTEDLDGGYDVIGLGRCPPGLFDDIPWSQAVTFEESRRRFTERGMRVVALEKWWDVDEIEDLDRLRELVSSQEGRERAPATAAALLMLTSAATGDGAGPAAA